MPSLSDKKISEIITLIYDNITENSQRKWLDTFKIISELVSSGPGNLSFFDEDKNEFDLVVSTLDEVVYKEYLSHYHKISPFRKKIEKMKAGEKFIRSENISDEAFLQTEIYQEYFRRQDVFHFNYEVLFKENGISGGICITRSESMEDFNTQEDEAISLLIPHLRRALYLFSKINEVQQDTQIFEDVLNSIPQSVIVVNKKGKAIYINDNARNIIAENDGLNINRRGDLITGLIKETKKLRKLLQGVFYPNIAKKNLYGGTMKVSRPTGLKPYLVLVSPISESNDDTFGNEKAALVFITDLEQKRNLPEQVLCEIYGLTPAESKLACILAEGKTVKEACEILEITVNTARTHLKHIFSKTDTNRQSDLVRLILISMENQVQEIEYKS